MITPWSRCSLGPQLTALAITAPTSNVWPAANRAYYVPFTLHETVTVVKMFCYNGSVIAGTIYVSVYNSALASQFPAGSALQAGTNQIQEFDTADTSLVAGKYYMAISLTSISAELFSINEDDIIMTLAFLESLGVSQEASAAPLPNTATLALPTGDPRLPYFGLSLRTLVT